MCYIYEMRCARPWLEEWRRWPNLKPCQGAGQQPNRPANCVTVLLQILWPWIYFYRQKTVHLSNNWNLKFYLSTNKHITDSHIVWQVMTLGQHAPDKWTRQSPKHWWYHSQVHNMSFIIMFKQERLPFKIIAF